MLFLPKFHTPYFFFFSFFTGASQNFTDEGRSVAEISSVWGVTCSTYT